MPEHQDLAAQVALLKRLYEQGLLSETNYRAALTDLGVQPETIFDLRGEKIEQQINVAGNYIDQRQRVEPGASPEAWRRAYLFRVMQQTRRLPLSGVDPKSAGDESSSDLMLSAVYTALLTQRPAPDDETSPPARSLRGEPARHLSALDVLNREPRLALLGDPGSGKTTFANFVALCLAGEALGDLGVNLKALTTPLPAERDEEESKPQPWEHGVLLPVRIVLRDLAARGLPPPGQPASGDTLWNFIASELGETLKEFAPHLKRELLERGGLILLDGLDEVPDAHQRREQVKQAVQGFAADFARCRFIVTSRTYAYQRQDWKLEGFAEAVLSPFTPKQIEHFVERWYAHIAVVRSLSPEDTQGRAALLKTAIQRSERLMELAARPLLLTLMASLHAWRGGSLPERREELYADAVDLLLDQWESPKVVRDAQGKPLVRQPSLAEWLEVDRAVVRAELNRLAFEAHRDQPKLAGTADVAQERLVCALMNVTRNPNVNPARLVEYIRDRAGLLAARGEGIYTFPHRTFQEYLAACHLTDHGFPRELAKLLRADPGRWREAALLAGAKASRGTASAAWNLAEALCFHEPPVGQAAASNEDVWGALLAAQTLIENEGKRLADVAEWDTPKLDLVRRWLLAIVARGELPPVDRALAGEALSVLGDDRDFDELIPIPTGPFLMGSTDADEMSQDNEKPQHEITLPMFKIGKYLVTNAQYLRFVQATGREWESDERERPERQDCPAVDVTWHDARAYCEWLTRVWRKEGRIASNEIVRLPTEAEWEKAARGPDGRIYPWGDEWDAGKCNADETSIGRTCAVGLFSNGASSYGCLDMAGNVWEWTASLWGKDYSRPDFKYPYDPKDGRENLEADDGVLRVLRGGAFYYDRFCVRCAFRVRSPPGSRNWYSGFRLVVSPVSPISAL